MIRNIIYDVGYVLCSYTWREDFRCFGYDEEGVKRLASGLFDSKTPGNIRTYWEMYDRREVTDQQIEEYCYSHFPEDRRVLEWFFEDPSIWCVYLHDLADTIPQVKKKGYRTYLLSNYPERLWDLHIGKAPFRDFLDGMTVSWQEGIGKPDMAFYKTLLERYSLLPEECLFMDDRAENTEAARRLGISTITVDTPAARRKAVSVLDSLPELV